MRCFKSGKNQLIPQNTQFLTNNNWQIDVLLFSHEKWYHFLEDDVIKELDLFVIFRWFWFLQTINIMESDIKGTVKKIYIDCRYS